MPVLANPRNDVFLQGGCNEYLNFLGSSQVASSFCDDNYCDSLLKNFSEKIETCCYHDVHYDFNRIPNSYLLIMHVNIRSLQKEINFDHFLDTLETLKRKPDIICISETRIKETLVKIDIEGFDFVFTCPNFTSGDVGVYVSNKLTYHLVIRNWLNCADCEDMWLSIANPSMGSIFNVIAIYRHPNTNIANFIDKLDEALDSHNLLNATTYILGDINIDINKFDRPAASQNYLDILCSHGLFP